MRGLSSQVKESISRLIEQLFDRAALRLLGNVPKLQHKRTYLVGFEQTPSLANIFVQAMGNKYLNHTEQDVLKGILDGTYSYVDILKNKTTNDIIQQLEGLAREARISNTQIPKEELDSVIKVGLDKARSHLETIAGTEGTKSRNLGSAMDITRDASEKDPVVGFAVLKDKSTCEECIRVNLMDDGITPRLYRMSELSAGYFKRGDKVPSLLGQHPNCRCTLINVPKDWGFDPSGHITFIAIGHSEINKQRKE